MTTTKNNYHNKYLPVSEVAIHLTIPLQYVLRKEIWRNFGNAQLSSHKGMKNSGGRRTLPYHIAKSICSLPKFEERNILERI